MPMNHQSISPTSSPLSLRLGFWSAIIIAVLFIVFTICFVALALKPPLFMWTNLSDCVAFAGQRPQRYQNIARFAMLVFGPAEGGR
jgi:hypothetical protein